MFSFSAQKSEWIFSKLKKSARNSLANHANRSEIDRMVYGLCELTEGEIKIV